MLSTAIGKPKKSIESSGVLCFLNSRLIAAVYSCVLLHRKKQTRHVNYSLVLHVTDRLVGNQRRRINLTPPLTF